MKASWWYLNLWNFAWKSKSFIFNILQCKEIIAEEYSSWLLKFQTSHFTTISESFSSNLKSNGFTSLTGLFFFFLKDCSSVNSALNSRIFLKTRKWEYFPTEEVLGNSTATKFMLLLKNLEETLIKPSKNPRNLQIHWRL